LKCFDLEKVINTRFKPFDDFLKQKMSANKTVLWSHPSSVPYKGCTKVSHGRNKSCELCFLKDWEPKAQDYRHVDFVEFFNNRQVEKFYNSWTEADREDNKRRFGWLYGWYTKDPLFDNFGVRVLVEGIYVPAN
jgi:hypothetical protein